MKPPVLLLRVLIGALILALGQVACSLAARSSSPAAQPTGAGAAQSAQPSAAVSAKHGTPEQAMAMLKEAVAHYNSVGRTQALADFNNRVDPFFKGDLYVACIDSSLKISANGGFPNLVGSATEPLSRKQWDSASTNKIDSVNYAYTDPVTKTTEPKTLYYEKVGSDVCGVGAYHP